MKFEFKALSEMLKDQLVEPKFASIIQKVQVDRDLKLKLKIEAVLKILNDTLLETQYDNKLKR